MEIKHSLEELGFSAKEIHVYLSVLRLGKTTPAKVSKITKLNRGTVYSVVKSLISKGVIAEDLADKALHLVPLPLESLKASFEKEKVELAQKERTVDLAIEELRVLTAAKNYSVPKIRFIEQGEIADFLYHNFDKWWKTVTDPEKAMYGFQDHSFTEHYRDWIEHASKKMSGERAKVRLFSNVADIEHDMRATSDVRDIRFLEGSTFTSSTWAVGDYLVMIYTRNEPFYILEIHDPAMAANMGDVFRTMWKSMKSKPVVDAE